MDPSALALDFWGDRPTRILWVANAPIVMYPIIREEKKLRRKPEPPPPKHKWVLRLGCDFSKEEKLRREREAKKKTALSTETKQPRIRDVYVKGAQDWEKNAWKVWDKKKDQEEVRRSKYSTALTSYIAGSKIVVREEPPAVQLCAHCDIGGGIHPLRRCMGCMAVAYCCRAHQKIHWQWHKHICFAIRAANNLEARKGVGAGWVKLRPRRWRRPPIPAGCVVETNCRARWANWKQFYTNGAQSMLNQMGDGGPFVFREWDEAVASMAMCEEATFVFSVNACQRMQMPYVGARKCPPGSVCVIEVGLIDVRWDNMRIREVDAFLTTKFIAEKRQEKLDRLQEQKLMRLRDRQDRKDKMDMVQKLLKADTEDKIAGLGAQKDKDATALEAERADAAAPENSDVGGANPPNATGAVGDKDEWAEEPEVDYEGFDETEDFFATEEDDAANRLAPETIDDAPEPSNVPTVPHASGVAGLMRAPPPRTATAADDPWASIDAVTTDVTRERDQLATAAVMNTYSPPPTSAAASSSSQTSTQDVLSLLEPLGLLPLWPALQAAGLTELSKFEQEHHADPAAFNQKLSGIGLKMGQRQKLLVALKKA